jgi:hypothetical protein
MQFKHGPAKGPVRPLVQVQHARSCITFSSGDFVCAS